MKRSTVDRDRLSPMMLQYMEIKDQYEDSIIFFRLGDFYEMFFEDAITCSRELELTLTGKQAGLLEKVPMCGVPHHAYSNYIDTLINKGYKVAICEQIDDPKTTKGMVRREVIQVVTKGTRLDERLDAKDHNFIASLYDFGYCYALSYADITTGEFFAELFSKDLERVMREVAKLGLQEVIVNDAMDREIVNILRTRYQILVTIRKEELKTEAYSYIYASISDERIIITINHLLSYLLDTKKKELTHLQKCIFIKEQDHLLFDVNTKKNLELTETMRSGERQYSLLWLLDKNKTAMGSRFLKYNIENPLTSRQEIERRYDMVERLSTEFILRDDLIKCLDKVYDLERLAGRISYGNLNARDMLQLKTSLQALPELKKILIDLKYDKEIEPIEEVASLLEKSISEDAPFSLREGGLLKSGYNSELDELRSIRSGSKDFILELERKEKERTGIKGLKVGFNKVFGYYIEVSKANKDLIKDEFGYDRKQTLANCERYITQELKEKENIILGAEEKIINLEYKLFMDIREVVKRYIDTIQKQAKIISEVDMLQAFSFVSEQGKYVRPELIDEHSLELIDCRHPVVEKVMRDKYIANDVLMDKTTNVLLITGPNMAGKSTYMRQTAITVIMAQIGCFVPCSKCRMPIFNKIFTRIGASDDLVSGESTFMVEMKEANYALQEADENSLILFDELGRGTATYDGMSLAQAILEYIHDKIKAKTLFSTHYHELTILEKDLKELKNVHVSAMEEKGKLTFLHKVKAGAVDKSYGIHVAGLANLPESLVERALDILNVYEHKNVKKETFTQTSLFEQLEEEIEKAEEQENPVEKQIRECNPLEMTPIDALNFIYELQRMSKKM